MFFKNFTNAIYCLDFPVGTTCLEIAQCDGSYEYFSQNNRVLHCIGQGPRRSPGHPSGNQRESRQCFLHGPSSLQAIYPVFRIFANCIEYVGNYRLLSWKKKISFEGFIYFEFTLSRVSCNEIRYAFPSTLSSAPDPVILAARPSTDITTEKPVIVDVAVRSSMPCLPCLPCLPCMPFRQ